MLQRFVVTPNEQARESPFIQHNIDATRRAFALDRVEERALTGDAMLTREDIGATRRRSQNVRLWDHQPLLDTFGQLQEIRTYYDFVVGRQRPLHDQRPSAAGHAVAARAQLEQPAEPHVGQRAPDVHARLRADARTGEPGDQRRAARAVRPESAARDDPRAAGRRSRASTSASCRTTTSSSEPPRRSSTIRAATSNVFTQYAGSGGLPLGVARAAGCCSRSVSAPTRSRFNDGITGESRILFHRNIRERVDELAPFLTFDRDPYLVLADGRLVLDVRRLHHERPLSVFDAGRRGSTTSATR